MPIPAHAPVAARPARPSSDRGRLVPVSSVTRAAGDVTVSNCTHGHRHGGRPCGRCRRDATLAAVIAAEASLPAGQVMAAFDTAMTTGRGVAVLEAALVTDPDVLDVGAPPAVGRLVEALVAAGSTTFTRPSCVTCGQTGRPLTVTGLGGTCSRCVHRASATACSQCGQVKPVAGRTGDGEPICERCRRRTRGQRPCGICGTTGPIAVRARPGRPDVCASCYRLPEAVCGRCGRTRPCHFASGDTPICKGCAPRATTPCVRCGHDRPPSARWPDGPVCEPCYRTALAHRGPCDGCGRQRRLIDPPGPSATTCADCAGVAVPSGHVCADCGHEDRLFERGRCVRCALTRRATGLLADDTGQIPDRFAGLFDAIVGAPQPYSATNWLRTGTGAAILAEIADGRLAATHEALDSHPRPRAADHLRRILVAHGLLDDRD